MDSHINYYEEYACKWLNKSIEALLSHKREKGFIRNSDQLVPKDDPRGVKIFPTATFQGFAAFLECESAPLKKTTKSDQNIIEKVTKKAIEEVKQLITEPSLKTYTEGTTNRDDRTIILFEQILFILSQLKKKRGYSSGITFKVFKDYIMGNTTEMEGNRIKKYYFPTVGSSPWFLLSLLNCQDYIYDIYGDELQILLNEYDANPENSQENPAKQDKERHDIVEQFKEKYKLLEKKSVELEERIDDHINYHLARYNVKELSFDSISLAVAICCKIKVNNKFKNSPFFISCIKAILGQQYSDGSLPTGATISFEDSGDVIQQASIQVMSFLADAIVDYKFLVDYDTSIEELLDILCPAFRKMANCMEFSHETFTVDNNSSPVLLKGWGSDRLKIKNYTETWINSYACRFFYKYWLLEKSYLRIKALKNLGNSNYVYDNVLIKNNEDFWYNKIIEPDHILYPKAKIDSIIKPIIDEKKQNSLLITPKAELSFIICGPPGSGKTFIVERMADAIGWPLVELSPSQFIKNGLEFIESTSKEIFNNLFHLHHAIVFFDECDELFRDRETDGGSSHRTILSFMTASMLPKLQKLHDKKNVIFVVGTNYLHRIDPAIRREGRFDYLILFDRPDETARGIYYDKNKDEIATKLAEGELVNRETFIQNTNTMLIKGLNRYFRKSSEAKPDQSYIDWCHKERGAGKKPDGHLELECIATEDDFEKKIKIWNKFKN